MRIGDFPIGNIFGQRGQDRQNETTQTALFNQGEHTTVEPINGRSPAVSPLFTPVSAEKAASTTGGITSQGGEPNTNIGSPISVAGALQNALTPLHGIIPGAETAEKALRAVEKNPLVVV